MTRRRDRAAAEDEALSVLTSSFVPAVCLVGKSSPLHVEKVIRVSREENLAMIADSIAYCAEQGKRAIFDAEHFFDGYREDSVYALECVAAAAGAGAENVTLCDTNGGSLPSYVAEATAAVVAAVGGPVEIGIHTHDDSGCGVANSLAAVEAGARLVQGCVNGYGERCGNANLATILPALQLKMGFAVVAPEQLASLTSTAHYLDELCNLTPDPDRPYVGRNAFAHKAGMHAAGVAADASTFEHLDPATVGNERDIVASELAGKATIRSQAEHAGIELDDEAATRAMQRLKEREHDGYHYEAAPASFELLLRREAGHLQAALPARELPRRGREARRRRGHDRGDDQGRGRRQALLPGGRGQRPGQRPGQGPAHGDRRPLPAPRRGRADQLQGADPRRSPRHRRRHPRPPRLRRRRARVGDDGRLGEHHRGLLGGARRLAGVRLPVSTDIQPIPLARPELGSREEELVLEVLRSGQLSLGPMGERFEREFAAWLGVERRGDGLERHRALHLGVRVLGWGEGDEVVTSPFSFVASANCLLYEGAKPVFADVEPETLDLDPAAAAAAVGERTVGLLPVHIFGYPAAMPELEALAARHGLGILEDACEALGAVDSEGRKVGARGNLATFAFYANKQMTTGEGGMIVPRDADEAARLRSERNQGRAVDMGWLDHDRLGFNYRLSDLAAALGVAQVEKLDSLLSAARAGGADVRGAAGGDRGRCGRRSPPAARSVRSWFVYTVRLPRGRRPRRDDRPPRRARRRLARPTCPASTSSRTCASSATARVSSRSPKPPRPTRWRCRSSRR